MFQIFSAGELGTGIVTGSDFSVNGSGNNNANFGLHLVKVTFSPTADQVEGMPIPSQSPGFVGEFGGLVP